MLFINGKSMSYLFQSHQHSSDLNFPPEGTVDQYNLGHLHCVFECSGQMERDQSNQETTHSEWEWQQ